MDYFWTFRKLGRLHQSFLFAGLLAIAAISVSEIGTLFQSEDEEDVLLLLDEDFIDASEKDTETKCDILNWNYFAVSSLIFNHLFTEPAASTAQNPAPFADIHLRSRYLLFKQLKLDC